MITLTTSHDTPGIPVSDVKYLYTIRTGSPPIGATDVGAVGENRRLSTNNWLTACSSLPTERV